MDKRTKISAWVKIILWRGTVPSEKGRTFYTSMGHSAEAWKQEPFVKMLENVVNAR